MSEIMVKKENFKEEVLDAKETVLVDFYADWCGPCKMLAPILHEVAVEYAESVKVCKVNVSDEMELADEYKVSTIPTLMVFKDGVMQKRSSGFADKETIVKMWE